jgi:uncharacterized protein YjiS (DUF1127 family)
MRKLIPTRRFFERAKSRMTFRDQLSELSDWFLRNIGIFRRVLSLEAVKPFWMA